MKNSLINNLYELELSSEKSLKVLHPKTRDKPQLNVLKCSDSGVIVLEEIQLDDNYYQFNQEYSPERKKEVKTIDNTIKSEPLDDDLRRFNTYSHLIKDSSVLDFGCGSGSFLFLSSEIASTCTGIELNRDNRTNINKGGIDCFENISELPQEKTFDLITLHHVFEHLSNPIKILKELGDLLTPDGQIIIEVPHARDFLLETFKLEEFMDFTFWSEHLILHTKESLESFLKESGLKTIKIEGYQRYPLSNHLYWLHKGKPSGHEVLNHLNDPEFHEKYQNLLAEINQTDTLIGYFKK